MAHKTKLIALILIMINLNTMAASHEKNSGKKGILLVSFGTSYANAQNALDNIEEEVKKAFPDVEVRWAYTSNIIRRKLKKQGQSIDSPSEALARMGSDGFTHIAVQSLHVIPGEEYESLRKTVSAFNHIPKNTKAILIGKPLLYAHQDVSNLTEALVNTFPSEIKKDEAVLLMGHGTHHPSNIYYPGMQFYLSQKSPMYFMGTVEGYPELSDIIPTLKAQKVKTIWLMPFMSVAGDHAQNDMAGEGPDSWKSQLEAEGFKVNVVMKGLAEYDSIVQIWVNHLTEVFHELEE